MKVLLYPLMVAASLPLLTPSASAVVLLTDDFTVTSGNSQNVNQDLAGRLGGSLAAGYITSGVAYTASVNDHHQVGNNSTDVGQPGGAPNSNYVLLAFNGSFQTSLDVAATATGPVTIEYDLYLDGTNPGGGAADKWAAVTLRSAAAVDGWPVVGAGEFGFLTRADGRMQGFQGAYPGAWDADPAALGFATADHWKLVFTDSAGTGSAFNGNGSQVTFINGATTLGTVTLNQLNSSDLHLTFRNLDNRFAGVDNLSISTVPEPSAALLLSSVGLMALLRRRNRRD